MALQSSYGTLSTYQNARCQAKKAPILIGIVVTIWLRHKCVYCFVDAGGSAVSGASLWPIDYRDRGFESRWRHGCCVFCLLYVVQVAASVTSLSLVQRSPTACVCVCF